jgi:pyrroline-5-carboxylate reductase
MQKGGFRTIVSDGMWAAYRRSLELGQLDSNVGPGRSKTGTREGSPSG